MGVFGAAHRQGVRAKKGPLSVSRNMPQIFCNDETWHSYTLPKEDPKNI